MSSKLDNIEIKLIELAEIDKKNWTQFYLLLKRVEDEQLWKDEYKSFTQWVKGFSVKSKVHETVIWQRKKAGAVYMSYYKTQQQKGIEVQPIEKINVSADSLVLLDKINKYNEHTASELVDKVLNKQITKKDLREVYKSIRPHTISTNPHIKKVIDSSRLPGDEVELPLETITATKIVSSLCNSQWLGKKRERKFFRSAYENNKYSVFTEFPVFPGTSRKSRRIDMLVAENMTTENVWELNLHGIEIKVSKGDLIGDNKYSEYVEFVDYMWLAIPHDLIEVAEAYIFKGCGLLAINGSGTVEVIQKACKINSLRKQDTLTSMALKLI